MKISDFAKNKLPQPETTKKKCKHCKKEKQVCEHGNCANCQCDRYCWLD